MIGTGGVLQTLPGLRCSKDKFSPFAVLVQLAERFNGAKQLVTSGKLQASAHFRPRCKPRRTWNTYNT